MKLVLKAETVKSFSDVVVKGTRAKLDFSVKTVEDKVLNTITTCEGGIMQQLSFAASAPKQEEFVGNVVVPSDNFLGSLQALSAFDGDVTFDVQSSKLELSVGKKAKLSVPLVKEDLKLLPQDISKVCARVVLDGSVLQTLLKGFSKPEPDERQLTDRVVLRLSDNTITAYSTDGIGVGKQTTTNAMVELDSYGVALTHLLKTGSLSSDEDKAVLQAKMTEQLSNRDAIIDMAKEYGMETLSEHEFALPSASISTLLSITKGMEQVAMIVTPKFLYVKAGSVNGTFSIGTKCASVYKDVDCWVNNDYTSVVTVDRDELSKAVTLLSATQPKCPVLLKGGKEKVTLSAGDGSVSVNLVEGNPENFLVNLSPRMTLAALSMLKSGNISLGYTEKKPVRFTNGGVGDAVKSLSQLYLLPIVTNNEHTKKEADGSSEKE